MNSKSVEIYVFSGSGNTFLLAEAAAGVFNANGREAVLRPLPGEIFPARPDCALGLSFPVACFATYPFVIKFLQSLPPGGGREAFYLGSMAAFSFSTEEAIRRLLVAKNYKPVGCCIPKMPSNYGKHLSPASPANQNIIKTGTGEAAAFASRLLDGKTVWDKKTVPWSGFFYRIAQGQWPWRLFRWFFPLQINNTRCVQCGFCRGICPADAIETKAGALSINSNCVGCQHCAAFCPQAAIGIGGQSGSYYRAAEYSRITGGLRRQ